MQVPACCPMPAFPLANTPERRRPRVPHLEEEETGRDTTAKMKVAVDSKPSEPQVQDPPRKTSGSHVTNMYFWV